VLEAKRYVVSSCTRGIRDLVSSWEAFGLSTLKTLPDDAMANSAVICLSNVHCVVLTIQGDDTMGMTIPQNTCPACRSARRKRIPAVNAWDGIEWQHVRCSDCKHRYLELYPSDEQLTRMYDKSYFSDGGGWVCGYWGGSYESNERHLRDEAVRALRDIPVKRGRILEIGCAGGFFLDEARVAGFDVTGVELNPEMAEHARTKLGLTVHCGMFEDVGLEPHSFDVVVVQDVLEHIRDPRAFVTSVYKLLRPDGCFFVRGPLEQQAKEGVYLALRSLTGRGNRIVKEPPFHLQGFTRHSFAAINNSAGLTPRTFSTDATRPAMKLWGAKNAAATVIGYAAFLADKILGRGDFMTATAFPVRPVSSDIR